MSGPRATARAHANIALVKYWGKRQEELNIPAADSLSLTLSALTTTATVCFDEDAADDSLTISGQPAPEPAQARLATWLDLIRERAGIRTRATVDSHNDFPTAAGLASSASAYAALAVAASRAAGLDLDRRALSMLARAGSGSAARSLFGGVAILYAGTDPAGADSYAECVNPIADWDLRMVIAIVGSGGVKKVSSRDGMIRSAQTSPLHAAWLATVPEDIAAARRAIAARDLAALGKIAEGSAMAMHAAAMAARPSLRYFAPTTLSLLREVEEIRSGGLAAHYTVDAGPHVKVLTSAVDAEAIATRLGAVDGVARVLVSSAGGPATEVSQ